MTKRKYYGYAAYLKQVHGSPTYRVGVDAGFSCPNRISGRASHGCSFCDEHGSTAVYQRDGTDRSCILPLSERITWIKDQISRGTEFLARRYGTDSFMLYYQAFSSTYGDIAELKSLYDAGLGTRDFKELIVSTRPDCVDESVAELLGGYVENGTPVWVELGLQSSSEATLERIQRGHTVGQFDSALSLLRKHGILVAAHVIFGLPGEGRAEAMATIDYLAQKQIDGVKIHDLHIPKNSPLFREYLLGELAIPSPERHLSYVIDALERLPEDTVIMRLTCDTPDQHRAVPIHPVPKGVFFRRLQEEMEARDTWQGRLYQSNLT